MKHTVLSIGEFFLLNIVLLIEVIVRCHTLMIHLFEQLYSRISNCAIAVALPELLISAWIDFSVYYFSEF